MNVLFVCSRNKWRSATAENIYKKNKDHNFRSAGTEPSAVKKLSVKDILWSDIIFVMEKKHKQRILEKFGDDARNKSMILLDIKDDYQYMDPELVDMIRITVDPYLIENN